MLYVLRFMLAAVLSFHHHHHHHLYSLRISTCTSLRKL